MSIQPDLDRDVIVQHVKGKTPGDERWLIFVGSTKRAELIHPNGALVFARLLADLQQGRVWLRHEDPGELSPLDHRGLLGCSCC
jgi:hypothetical protein